MIDEPTLTANEMRLILERTLRAVRQRFKEAIMLEQNAKGSPQEEILKKQAKEKLEKAKTLNLSDLQALAASLNDAIENNRRNIEAKFRPLQFSSNPEDIQRAQYWENKAFRIAQNSSLEDFEKDFYNAVQNGFTDYATELLYWAEKFLTDSSSKKKIKEFMQKYGVSLGIEPFNQAHQVLVECARKVSGEIKLIEAGLTSEPKTAQDLKDRMDVLGV